ncbi:leucine-rich repeat receptor-like protein kinase [Corchorus olitorius]|uniref:Leucine-rich repeat receptor-like protein kinase n=1 Tax=Corchorus olitorius TaxID=93759 RepID=A0A1R3GY79_9ROSI|nr:leucine-rich repeat receptor-like protein kinase [Corchorus olitorius]
MASVCAVSGVGSCRFEDSRVRAKVGVDTREVVHELLEIGPGIGSG